MTPAEADALVATWPPVPPDVAAHVAALLDAPAAAREAS